MDKYKLVTLLGGPNHLEQIEVLANEIRLPEMPKVDRVLPTDTPIRDLCAYPTHKTHVYREDPYTEYYLYIGVTYN